jgi:thiol:disulfide interchange protein DsbG
MWDAMGHNVTRDQVAPIPGGIPMVKIGPEDERAKATPEVDENQGADPLSLVQQTTYGHRRVAGRPTSLDVRRSILRLLGARDAAARAPCASGEGAALGHSAVGAGLREGRITPAARIMVSEPKDQMVADWVAGSLTGTTPADTTALPSRNMTVASTLHLRGTPTFIWKSVNGSAARADGIPPDLNAVITSIRT